MAHLETNEHHWYLGSPFQMVLTIDGVVSADLEDITWRIDDSIEVTTITAEDDENGDAVVTVTFLASALDSLTPNVYDWQLMGSVGGTGPEVLAIGKLRLDSLAQAPSP